MDYVIVRVLSALTVPPVSLLVLLPLAVLLVWRRPRTARNAAFIGLLALYALSLPAVANRLLDWLEPPPLDPGADRSGEAIVVLGGGAYHSAPEYGGDTVDAHTLVRLRYAARLQRALRKPLLVSGGRPRGGPTPEALAMQHVLQEEFRVPVTWTEPRSATTLANARESFRVLSAAGVKRVYLVTHAYHMRRARYAFESAGFGVIPAPTGYTTRAPVSILDFVPAAQAFLGSTRFFHEVIGIAWYRLRIALGR